MYFCNFHKICYQQFFFIYCKESTGFESASQIKKNTAFFASIKCELNPAYQRLLQPHHNLPLFQSNMEQMSHQVKEEVEVKTDIESIFFPAESDYKEEDKQVK